MGATGGLVERIARAWTGPVEVATIESVRSADPPPGPNDSILVRGPRGVPPEPEVVAAFRAVAAKTPVVVWVSGHPGTRAGLLAAGAAEFVSRADGVPAAIEQARARASAQAETRHAAPGPSAGAYDGLFPNLYDWIYVVGVGEDGTLTFETVNPPLHAASDFLNPDFSGRTPEACLPAPAAAAMRSHFERVLREEQPMRFEEEQSVGGRTRSFQTILTPVRNKWGRIHRIAGISRDTTALTEAQAALRASEERLAHALEGTQQGLWDWDLTSGAVYRSPRWFEMLGLVPGELDGTLDAGLGRIHPDDRAGVDQAIRLHLGGHLPRFQAEYRIRTGGGDWLWFFDAGKVVRWGADGAPARIAGMCTDITERRRAEESLRALVGGVVHEMRNPAFGIGVNLDALEATFGEDAAYRPFVGAIRESCHRILNLMNDLRDYGEPRTFRAEPCKVHALVIEAVRMCEPFARERGCSVHVAFADNDLVLPLHAFRMQQVFRNLLENALHYAPAGGEVVVSGRIEGTDRQRWFVLDVEDGGAGFDAEALARAFEPFFTRRKGGTGLGLSIVRRVVDEHGGTVDAANRPGGGAIVTVRLPLPGAQPTTEVPRG